MEWWMVLCGKGDEATLILIGWAPAGMARGQIGVCPGFRLPRPSRRSGDGTVRAQRRWERVWSFGFRLACRRRKFETILV